MQVPMMLRVQGGILHAVGEPPMVAVMWLVRATMVAAKVVMETPVVMGSLGGGPFMMPCKAKTGLVQVGETPTRGLVGTALGCIQVHAHGRGWGMHASAVVFQTTGREGGDWAQIQVRWEPCLEARVLILQVMPVLPSGRKLR